MKKYIVVIICCFTFNAFAQKTSKKDEAKEIMHKAIEKMDKGEFDESIELLNKAQKLDHKNNIYQYEIAYARYSKKEYYAAIDILEKIINDKYVEVEYYRLLGNAYDMTGNPDKAIDTYMKGVPIFPENAGKLYSEAGLVEYSREKYNEAIDYWEKGIKATPYFASNYYRLATLFALTDENIWTIFYGELFMNLEMGTKRTSEISNILYKTYNKTYVKKSDTEGEFFLTKNTTVYVDPNEKLTDTNMLNFELSYLTAYSINANFSNGISIKSIYEAKKGVISTWFEKGFEKTYPNALFDLERRMIAENVYEAYVYWLLSYGDESEYNGWYDKDKFESLTVWVKQNQLDLTPPNKYSRQDYLQR